MDSFTLNFSLILSLISLGFFGGFSHCIGMCGPFVVSQVSNRLQSVELENFSRFERLKNFALLPYQLGRITTYSLIGFSCSALGSVVRDFVWFRYFSAWLLVVAAFVFLKSAIPTLRLGAAGAARARVRAALAAQKVKKLISKLFQNPRGLRGYLLGIILGFIPCGLLYGAFAICATIPNPLIAAFAMFCFGASTFPALFTAGSGGYFLIKHSGFKLIAKAVLLLNSAMLFLMAARLIF